MPTSFANWRTEKSETLRAEEEEEEEAHLAVDARIDPPRSVGEFGFLCGAPFVNQEKTKKAILLKGR